MARDIWKNANNTRSRLLWSRRSEGVDMRQEFDDFINGDDHGDGQGHWVIHRSFDRETFAEVYNQRTGEGVYNQVTGEGIRGQVYSHVDSFVRVRAMSLSAGSRSRGFAGEGESMIGRIPNWVRVYYFPHTSRPVQEDIIFEIDYEGTQAPEKVASASIIERYDVTHVEPFRGDGGRIEFYKIFSVSDVISH